MKILSNKQYNDLIYKIETLENEKNSLIKELDSARDLKAIVEKLYQLTFTSNNVISFTSTGTFTLSDNIPQYVDDYFGGRVIKQEATKVVVLEKDGAMHTHYTKQKPDKGYNYKLIRM